MAAGSVVLEALVPPRPTSAVETDFEYNKKIKETIDIYYTSNSLQPARFGWTDRYDIPETESATTSFIEGLLSPTSINLNTDRVDPVPTPGGGARYCIEGDRMTCYKLYQVVSRTAPHDPTMIVSLTLTGGEVVDIEIAFMATWNQPFSTP